MHTVPLDRAGDAKVCLGMWKSREGWTNNSGESRGLSWVEIGGAACDVVGSKQAADPGSKAAGGTKACEINENQEITSKKEYNDCVKL